MVLWLLAMLRSYTLGGAIHVLPATALAMIAFRLIKRRSMEG